MRLIIGVCLLAAGILAGEDGAPHWSHHGEHGPAHWADMHEECASDNPRQSPIDIHTPKTMFEDDLTKIYLTDHYSKYREFTVVNSGHSVSIQFDHEVLVVGGDLPSKGYKLAQLHFHWGSNDDQGSEHTFDERRYPLEMHMVTFDLERYSEIGAAVHGDDSLAVFGTMFMLSEEDNPALNPLLDVFDEIREPGSKAIIKSFPLANLLPAATDKYFRYLGSLTTPPCAQSVIWTLFLHTQTISSGQLARFRTLLEGHDEEETPIHIQDNWRPVQPIHKRIIYRSFIYKSEMSQHIPASVSGDDGHGAATTQVAGVLTILALLLVKLF